MTFSGFVPLVAGVFHLQYVTAGVPIRFCAKFLQTAVPKRCWTHTIHDMYIGELCFCLSPSGLKLFVHGVFCTLVALCIVFADSLTSTQSVSLTTLDFQSFASLLSRRKCASSFSSWTK